MKNEKVNFQFWQLMVTEKLSPPGSSESSAFEINQTAEPLSTLMFKTIVFVEHYVRNLLAIFVYQRLPTFYKL